MDIAEEIDGIISDYDKESRLPQYYEQNFGDTEGDGEEDEENDEWEKEEHIEDEGEKDEEDVVIFDEDSWETEGGFFHHDGASEPQEAGERDIRQHHHKNLTNTGNTCYVDAPMQLLNSIHSIRDILRAPVNLIPLTGRHPRTLEAENDRTGAKHTALYIAIAKLFRQPDEPGFRLSKAACEAFFDACQSLEGKWDHQFHDVIDFLL